MRAAALAHTECRRDSDDGLALDFGQSSLRVEMIMSSSICVAPTVNRSKGSLCSSKSKKCETANVLLPSMIVPENWNPLIVGVEKK